MPSVSFPFLPLPEVICPRSDGCLSLSGPFCILGLRYLQQAIATAQSSDPASPLAHLDFELEFKPFLLDPTLTREPIDKREKYESRFGKEKFAKMEKVMQEKARVCGIDL